MYFTFITMIYTRDQYFWPDLIEPCVRPYEPRLQVIYIDHAYCPNEEYPNVETLEYYFDPVDNTTGSYCPTRDRWYIWEYTCKAPAIHTCAPPPLKESNGPIPF